MTEKTARTILNQRISQLITHLRRQPQGFDTALIISRVNLYYLTGTIQDGVLVLRDQGEPVFYVRKSYQRARQESALAEIRPMKSYRDLLRDLPQDLGLVYLETQAMPLAVLERFQRYFTIEQPRAIDPILLECRAVKDDTELEQIRESGRQHQHVMENLVPGLLKEGMTEADFTADLYREMVRLGYQGVSRFAMFQMEMVIGQLGFGENALYPTNFDGPGGMRGMSAAIPIIGSRDRRLAKGDLVFVDVGYGVNGYHTDKTQVYSFGRPPDPAVAAVHQACCLVLARLEQQLTAGAVPEQIYETAMQDLPPDLSGHFMGYQGEQVAFLGHGVGLQIDEAPILARKQKRPLQANMVVALEPKCGLEGIGMVGVEETYLVTAGSPLCLTGGPRPIMTVSSGNR